MAFQPIVDVEAGTIYAHEALVRGTDGAGAKTILDQVTERTRYRFDQRSRTRAVEMASRAVQRPTVSINFLPNAVYEPAHCIRATLKAAATYDVSVERIIFEISESEQVVDHSHLRNIIGEYRKQGLTTAIDDFGAGYSGLHLLADLQPDLIKLDMALTRNIDGDANRRAIVSGIVGTARQLGVGVIAEGIETRDELIVLQALGIRLHQGFLFARPAFETFLTTEELNRPDLIA